MEKEELLKSMGLNAGDGKKFGKPNNIFPVLTHGTLDFFKRWCVFIQPFVNLTNRESDVIASFLKQRYELAQSITDPSLLDMAMMSNDTKRRVIEECNITPQHFYVVMSALRKKGIVQNNSIGAQLIPNIHRDDQGVFKLLILFKDVKE